MNAKRNWGDGKDWDGLLEADRKIRQLAPNKGMTARNDELQIRIDLIRGFELWNTRPYHNYEDWSDGYIVSAWKPGDDGKDRAIAVTDAEDLDVALARLKEALALREKADKTSDEIYKADLNAIRCDRMNGLDPLRE